jgi:hypothetical protein
VGGILLGGAYTSFLKLTGQWEIKRLELQTSLMELEKEANQAKADRARAEGEKSLAESQGEIFESNARFVDRMSAVVTFWLALLPLGLFVLILAVGGIGAFVGAMLILAIGIVVYFRFEKRYVPFIEMQNVQQ